MSNIEGTKSSRLTKDEIALMARELVLVTLPHKDPGEVPVWTRQNGNVTLLMQPGYKQNPTDSRHPICIGYPYGSIARLILYWIVTETRRTGEPRLVLGKSLADFMRKLGITPDDSTGKRSSANSVHRQLERLIYARITIRKHLKRVRGKATAILTCRSPKLVSYGGTPETKSTRCSVRVLSP